MFVVVVGYCVHPALISVDRKTWSQREDRKVLFLRKGLNPLTCGVEGIVLWVNDRLVGAEVEGRVYLIYFRVQVVLLQIKVGEFMDEDGVL